MAARLITKSGRVTAYLPNLNAAVNHFRTFSTHYLKDQHITLCSDESSNGNIKYDISPELGPFGPLDKRFPLPGHVGLKNNSVKTTMVTQPVLYREPVNIDEFLTKNNLEKRQQEVFQQAQEVIEDQFLGEPSPGDNLECIAQQCPDRLKRDVQDLFPERDLKKTNLTVIVISQKTTNDMSGWSEEVEEERENLLAEFLGPHTNATMFETDERYRTFGFEIDDLGCCKVLRHRLWGTHSYVGCLFTDAPLDHPFISAMKAKN
ncbi:cobalamin trafficking protein CblD-like isoform X2 [Mytilus edulis]|uniref:cobalamin trafficking protein CblD-like isoform X2 n=1 Tax=Mytilus edulis TaxID=6550 RepID=UPI0039EF087D